jgi:hypothetical protein
MSMASEELFRSLNQIVLSLGKNLSLDKLIKTGKSEEIVRILMKLEDVKFLIFDGEIFQMLKNKVFCSFCLEKPAAVINCCGDKFCGACLQMVISQHEMETMQLVCPLCGDHLALQNSVFSFNQCAGCRAFLHFSYFQVQFPCHKLCNFCVKKIGDDQCFECKTCTDLIRADKSFRKCYRCSKQEGLSESFFLCYIHSYCFDCSRLCMAKGKCFECGVKIKEPIRSEILSLMTRNCYYCRKTKEKYLFTNKNCCSYNICMNCQFSKSETQCSKCGSSLP